MVASPPITRRALVGATTAALLLGGCARATTGAEGGHHTAPDEPRVVALGSGKDADHPGLAGRTVTYSAYAGGRFHTTSPAGDVIATSLAEIGLRLSDAVGALPESSTQGLPALSLHHTVDHTIPRLSAALRTGGPQ